MNNTHKIKQVNQGSIAEELGIESGDILVKINEKHIEDILDYYFLIEDEYIEVEILKENNESWILEIDKEYNEDLGIVFEDEFLSKYKSCSNKCIFCFIDQLPKGMRKTMYFKDDDSRLSFLRGNYITFTNMKDVDVDRIISYHMSPINISIHTTNPSLRIKMLKNKNAGKILEYLKKLYDAKIHMNGQIVLCKGINDGKELDRTISDLSKFLPLLQSVSVVPVGISNYREGLYHLEPFRDEDAKNVLEIIHKWQEKIKETYGKNFIHASDEFYIVANEKLPKEENYDGYLQFENGVGMMRLLIDEFYDILNNEELNSNISKEISLATAILPSAYIKKLLDDLKVKFPNININMYTIKNDFFGENITVSGLLTGGDIIKQLKGKDLGEYLILPSNLLKDDEAILLDDIKITDIENELKVKIRLSKSSGKDLIDCIIN